MKKLSTTITLPVMVLTALPTLAYASTAADLIDDGEVKLDLRLRYEHVDQSNALKDADALTLRTRLTLTSGSYRGFSGLLEFEDSREVFVDDYNDGLGSNPNYSTVADPETTELDQAFVRYQNDAMNATLGRQVLVLDNQRYVGHVGWRQDRQTFDAASLHWRIARGVVLQYAYINQRNRIFADERDVDANDHLLNASVNTDLGKISGYAYLLSDDDNNVDHDTYGIRFAGKRQADHLNLSYALEYAMQDADNNNGSFDSDYYLVEAGVGWRGLNFKGGLEVLGSDGGNYGFSTPLATLHKFNGWADQFLATPNQGLEDYYLGVSGKALQGTWGVTYHNFDAENASAGVDDLGSEWDVSYTHPFAKHYVAGVKFAMYNAGDAAAGKVDTDKLWLWLGASF
ncbi:alginate export family protein [uncultured Ferrimonas sp.]|uniref:alginate export family protein n=1 Tax=uncultured Ferrimonas sp. TaxID=432640 RepID=UPI0026143001|nr:alginate export family protein [uncultured Ferrimonas sp.]